MKLNPGFPIFDHIFNTDFQVDHDDIPDTVLRGDDGEYLAYDDLPSHAKAEALFPIFVTSCLNLSSSPYQHVLQDVFGCLMFHARTSVCGFVITCKGSASDITDAVASYLHGRALKNLMGVPEEAFIRFVIITDFLRYHFDTLGYLSKKYRHLLSGKNNYDSIAGLLANYDGVKALHKPKKGFRNSDIHFFQNIKSTIYAERRTMTIVSCMDEASMDGHKNSMGRPFFFHYPSSSRQCKKESSVTNNANSKKRKATGGELLGARDTNRESLAMALHDDDSFDDSMLLVLLPI